MDPRRPLPLLLLCAAACAARVPEPEAPAPQPAPAEGRTRRVCWVELTTGSIPRGVAVARRSLGEDLEATQSGLLVESEGGTWLFDGGMASEPSRHLEGTRGLERYFLRRASADWDRVATAEEAVRSAGLEPSSLDGLIPTHAHFDHLGGLLELPGPPLWVAAEELADARAALEGRPSSVTPADAAGLVPRASALSFDGGPVWAWERSRDLSGDGSVVVFPLPGHTPGSLGAKVRLPDGRVAVLVGDTVWAREGYLELEPKGWPAGAFVDADRDATSAQIGRLWSLHRAHPEVLILPAHDRRAWVEAFGRPGCLGEG